jgi:hypothetical protein
MVVDHICLVQGPDISDEPRRNPVKESDRSCGLEKLGDPDITGQGARHVRQMPLESGLLGRSCTEKVGKLV